MKKPAPPRVPFSGVHRSRLVQRALVGGAASCALLFGAGSIATAQDEAPLKSPFDDDSQATTTAAASGSEFGDPVSVNGVRISDMAIKRYLVYGIGRNALDARKLQILMDHERKLRRSEVRENILDEMPDLGDAELETEIDKRMKAFDYDSTIVDRRLEKEKASFMERYPTLDYGTELRRAYKSGDWYRDQVRQTTEFDQLFFPEHPDDWPALSIEAIHQGSPQVDLVADYQREYERRLAVSVETGDPIVPEQEMMMQLMRDFVMGALWSLADVRTGSQGLEEELAMVIDGGDWRAEIRTEDVFDEMRASFAEQDIEDAKLALALMEAARQQMETAGGLIPIEEFRATVKGQRDSMKQSMFNFDFIALQGHGFPSSEAYEEHYHLVESYKKMKAKALELSADEVLSPELQAHMPIANGIMGLKRAHADTLLVSAFDFPSYSWKDNGWEQAYERATGLRAQIDAHLAKLAAQTEAQKKAKESGEKFTPESQLLGFNPWWSDFLKENSDYWDPPLPAVGKTPPSFGLKNYGAFQDKPMTRNDMKSALGESEYEHFLSNSAIVDTMFFEMEPGNVAGPFRGPKGYYIIYLKSATPPQTPLNIRQENHLAMLREDWARKSFQRYAHDALMSSDLSGL